MRDSAAENKKKIFYVIDTLGLVSSRVFNILFSFNNSYILITGSEKHSNTPLKMIVSKDDETISNVCDIVYNGKPSITHLKKSDYPSTYKKESNVEDNVDIIWLHRDRFYINYLRNKKFIMIPERISMIFDTSIVKSNQIEDFPETIRNDINKSLRKGYTCEIVENDEEKLIRFYQEMYVPYVSWKYGKTAKIATVTLLKHLYNQNGHILFIKHNGEYIFGGVFTVEKGKIITRYAGLMKDKYDHIKNGIMSLSYYQLIQWAMKRGITSIDFGSARPFFNDGLFSFKLKWDMKLASSNPAVAGVYALRFCKKNPAVLSFLKNNPFIGYNENKKFEAYIFKNLEKGQINANKIEKIQGIHTLKYISSDDLIHSS